MFPTIPFPWETSSGAASQGNIPLSHELVFHTVTGQARTQCGAITESYHIRYLVFT